MKVQYVADDGTSFDTEVECKSYELSQTFGADTRFLNVVDDMLTYLVSADDRGNPVIPFETEDEKTRVSIAIATDFQRLKDAFDVISAPKPKAKTKGPDRGMEIKTGIAKNRLRNKPASRMHEEDYDDS